MCCLVDDYKCFLYIGSNIFENISLFDDINGTLHVTWFINQELQKFAWNVSVSYRLVGYGNCNSSNDTEFTTLQAALFDNSLR